MDKTENAVEEPKTIEPISKLEPKQEQKPIHVREEVAKIAGVSSGTVAGGVRGILPPTGERKIALITMNEMFTELRENCELKKGCNEMLHSALSATKKSPCNAYRAVSRIFQSDKKGAETVNKKCSVICTKSLVYFCAICKGCTKYEIKIDSVAQPVQFLTR